MKNIIYIESTHHQEIIAQLTSLEVKGAHFTNGTYAMPEKIVIPTTLAGFKHCLNIQPQLPLIIAVNSDVSMNALNKSGFEHCGLQKLQCRLQ